MGAPGLAAAPVTPANSAALTPAEFGTLFDTFQRTVVRLEALPAYAVGGAEGLRLEAWRTGRPRPERSVRTDPWLARIALSTIAADKQWSRVRVVDDPLTDYQRYQLASHIEAQAVGDQVRIARRADVGDVGPDVWLFDASSPNAHAVVMRYTSEGNVDRRELVTDQATVGRLAGTVGAVIAASVPLNEFLAVVHA